MKRLYLCPRCRAVLNPGAMIVVRVSTGRTRALLLLSPQPGNYDMVLPVGFTLKAGDVLDYSCPVCTGDLSSADKPGMAELLIADGATEGRVLFSKTHGQHATLVITEESEQRFGALAEPKAGR